MPKFPTRITLVEQVYSECIIDIEADNLQEAKEKAKAYDEVSELPIEELDFVESNVEIIESYAHVICKNE